MSNTRYFRSACCECLIGCGELEVICFSSYMQVQYDSWSSIALFCQIEAPNYWFWKNKSLLACGGNYLLTSPLLCMFRTSILGALSMSAVPTTTFATGLKQQIESRLHPTEHPTLAIVSWIYTQRKKKPTKRCSYQIITTIWTLIPTKWHKENREMTFS